MKGEYPSASCNPISTALEWVGSLSSSCITKSQCHHFTHACIHNSYGNTAAGLSRVA